MSGVLSRVESEKRRESDLLAGERVRQIPPEPALPSLSPPPTLDDELVQANASYDPRPMPPQARYRWLRRAVMRTIDFFTLRQVWFNAAVCHVLNAWNRRLVDLHRELNALAAALDGRGAARIEAMEERRTAWESRAEGRLELLEARVGAAESDASEAVGRSDLDRARLERLEAELAELRRAVADREAGPAANC